jgi:hypothetical protein
MMVFLYVHTLIWGHFFEVGLPEESAFGVFFFMLSTMQWTKLLISNIRSDQNLEALSRQGHFLKGSAAALGIIKVKRNFEKIQYLGQGKGTGRIYLTRF